MSRNHEKLRVFQLANRLIPTVYKLTAGFPVEERYALQSQTRRAALSAATNIVEGSARRSVRDYMRFLDISLGSATEAEYLFGVAVDLRFLSPEEVADCRDSYNELARSLQKLLDALSGPDYSPVSRNKESKSPEPKITTLTPGAGSREPDSVSREPGTGSRAPISD